MVKPIYYMDGSVLPGTKTLRIDTTTTSGNHRVAYFSCAA